MSKLDFPSWFYEAMPELECPNPKCGKPLEENHIIAEGIRKSMVHKNETAFFIEYKCPKCNNITTIELAKMTLEDFVLDMIGKFTGDKDECEDDTTEHERPNNTKSDREKCHVSVFSKISDKEMKEIKKVIRDCESHYDFLKNIGLTDDKISEIEEEGKKKDN